MLPREPVRACGAALEILAGMRSERALKVQQSNVIGGDCQPTGTR